MRIGQSSDAHFFAIFAGRFNLFSSPVGPLGLPPRSPGRQLSLLTIGFNTDIHLGSQVCHVQTEVRGQAHPIVETVVYQQGRVVHRRTQECADLAAPAPGDSPNETLRRRVEEQHRVVIDDLRAGFLKVELDKDMVQLVASQRGIEVQLLNPASWAVAGTANLEISVISRHDRVPLRGAAIQVTLEGAQGPLKFASQTDGEGKAQLSFPMPRIGPGGAELVIQASAEPGTDEVRYALRTKPRTQAP